MKIKDKKPKLIVSASVLLITVICTVISFRTGLSTGKYKLLGSYASVFVLTALLWGFPLKFYITAMIFDVFATSLGSVINLYRYTEYFDRGLHFFSGLLLTECGLIIIGYILKKRGIHDDFPLKIVFAAFFAIACAGLWEIYEFLADITLKIHMQGAGNDTMYDMICGTIGALAYCALLLIERRFTTDKNIIDKKERG